MSNVANTPSTVIPAKQYCDIFFIGQKTPCPVPLEGVNSMSLFLAAVRLEYPSLSHDYEFHIVTEVADEANAETLFCQRPINKVMNSKTLPKEGDYVVATNDKDIIARANGFATTGDGTPSGAGSKAEPTQAVLSGAATESVNSLLPVLITEVRRMADIQAEMTLKAGLQAMRIEAPTGKITEIAKPFSTASSTVAKQALKKKKILPILVECEPQISGPIPEWAKYEWEENEHENQAAPKLLKRLSEALNHPQFNLADAHRLKLMFQAKLKSDRPDEPEKLYTFTGYPDGAAVMKPSTELKLQSYMTTGMIIKWKTPSAMKNIGKMSAQAVMQILGLRELLNRPVPVVFTDLATGMYVWILIRRSLRKYCYNGEDLIPINVGIVLIRQLLDEQFTIIKEMVKASENESEESEESDNSGTDVASGSGESNAHDDGDGAGGTEQENKGDTAPSKDVITIGRGGKQKEHSLEHQQSGDSQEKFAERRMPLIQMKDNKIPSAAHLNAKSTTQKECHRRPRLSAKEAALYREVEEEERRIKSQARMQAAFDQFRRFLINEPGDDDDNETC